MILKKQRSRALSAALCLLLIVSLLPAQVLATESDAAALKPGTYTVTANLVVPGQYNTVLAGVDAYPSNPDNPGGVVDANDPHCVNVGNVAPTMGLEDSAQLVIAQDGTMTLTLHVPNPVFTIQEIGGCDNAAIQDTSTVSGTYGAKTSRINKLVVELGSVELKPLTEKVLNIQDGAHGVKEVELEKAAVYLFKSCKEYPTLLFQEWTVPLELRVDFSAIPLKGTGSTPDTEVTRTYSDGNDYFSIDVTGMSSALPSVGTLNVKTVADQTRLASIQGLLESQFDGTLNYSISDLSILTENGETVTLPNDAEITVNARLVSVMGDPYIYQYKNEKLIACQLTKSDTGDASGLTANYSFKTDNLSNIVVLNSAGLSAKRFSDFEAGEYQITANLYVKGENNQVLEGVTAYLTNPAIPPTSAMEHNAVMRVDENGYLTIVINVENGVFSLQNIEDGESVHIVDSKYGADEGATPGLWGPHNGRIMQLTVTVDDLSGEYAFTGCKEYPTILEKDMEMPIHLGVDFDSAIKMLNGEGECSTFTDEQTGIKVSVQTTNSALDEKLGTASISVTEVTEGTLYNETKAALITEYVEEPAFKLYNICLLAKKGEIISLTKNDAVSVYFPQSANEDICRIVDNEIKRPTTRTEQSFVILDGTYELGQFIVVDTSSIRTWVNTTCVDSATGIMLKAYSVDADIHKGMGNFSERTKSLVGILATKSIDRASQEAALKVLDAAGNIGLERPSVDAIYRIGIVHTVLLGSMDTMDTSNPDSGASYQLWRGKKDGFVELILPSYDKNISYYLVTETGEQPAVTKLAASAEKGRLTNIVILPKELDEEDGQARMFSLYWGVRGAAPTAQRPISYIVAVSESDSENSSGDPITPAAPTDKTQTVTANLYLPGKDNQVLPGITVYLNNSNNPIQGTGTPTTPKSNNASLKTAADGTKTLTLSITNPVFTLQAIGGCSNARIIDTRTSSNLVYQGGGTGKYSTRISEITVELLDDSGEYVFESCTEFPTLLGVDWNFPLILAVNFDGGTDDSLDSNTGVDTSAITGGKKPATSEELPTAELSPAVTVGEDGVANVELTQEALEAALEQVKESGGSIVIEPEIEGSASKVNVDLPKSSAEAAAKAGAGLVVKTEAAAVSIPAEGLAEIVKASGSTVTISTEKLDDAVAVRIAVDGRAVEKVKGGIAVTVSAAKQSGNVLVLVDVDGTETVVKKSAVDKDTVKALLNGSATVKVVDRSKSFSDTANHWAADGIAFASSHELFQGVNDSQFAPDMTMSRGMLATVLYRLEDATEKGGSIFTDVTEEAWYADAVAWANEKGIVSGYGDGVFAPDDNITREQLAVMLYRYAQHLGMDADTSKDLSAYADADTVSSWAADAMQWAVEKGLITGRTSSTLAPGGTATRAETATILQRMVELIVK